MNTSCTNRRWKRRLCLPMAAVSLLLGAVGKAQTSAPPAHPHPPLTLKTTRAVHALAEDQAERAYPVRFQAVVVFYDPSINPQNGTLFVHDATGGIFVAVPARPALPLHEGTLVEISGVSGPGEFAPVVEHAHVRVLGQSSSPRTAPLVTLSQLTTGVYDSQWIQVEGVVHSILPQAHNMVVRLATSEGLISATTIQEAGADYDRLIDARVRIRAVAAAQFNHRRQLTGVHLFFPSLDDMEVERYGPSDPFALPLRSVNQLSRFNSGKAPGDRIHLRGSVTLQWPGRFVCIQDASGGVCVDSTDKALLPVGSLVDVIGFPAIEDATPTLTDATFRRSGKDILPLSSALIAAVDAMQGNHSGDLVAIEGEVVGLNSDPTEPAVVIASGGLIFPAILPNGSTASDLSKWPKGSRVRVLGICTPLANSQESDDRQGPARFESFRILMRSTDDLTILAAPSWWTPRHTIATLSVALLTTLVVLCWAIFLHRRVEQQTGLIRESEERFRHLAHHDPLTGLPNRALLHIRLDAAIEQAKLEHASLALLMMDLDGFKQVNDTLGHDGGDQMLCAAAKRIVEAVRRSDTVARMGGDEFIVLLCGLGDANEAREIAAKILLSLSAPLVIGTHCVPVSGSIGICTFPDDGEHASTLLKNADTAMYQAKALGRNRFQRYTPELAVDNFSTALMLQTASSGYRVH